MKEKITKIIPRNMIIPLICTLLCNGIAYYGTRWIMQDVKHYNISTWLDDQIPLIAGTVLIYFGCYLFWAVNYVIGCRQETAEAFRFISADFLAKLVCMVCFLVFPTTNTRPVIAGDSFWEQMMKWLYQIDAADNLFPSIHCLTSWFCFIAVRKNEKIPVWYRIASLLLAVSVCVSTLTTKQHVLIDVIAGIALAEGSYWFTAKSRFALYYQKWMSRANTIWEKL